MRGLMGLFLCFCLVPGRALAMIVAPTLVSKKPASKKPSVLEIIQKFSSVALKQQNGWECGYFAAFNALKLRVAVFDKDVASMGQEDYDAWVDEILANDRVLRRKKKAENIKDKYLGFSDIHRILLKTLGVNVLPKDIFVLEDKNTELPLPHDGAVLDAIDRFQQNFRGTEKPFYVIACDTAAQHWICVILFNNQCFVIDSLSERKRAVTSKIKTLFYESTLPTCSGYQAVAEQIKANISRKKSVHPIQEDAIKNHQFTQEMFDILLTKIKSPTVKKTEELDVVLVEDDDDDDEEEVIFVVDDSDVDVDKEERPQEKVRTSLKGVQATLVQTKKQIDNLEGRLGSLKDRLQEKKAQKKKRK